MKKLLKAVAFATVMCMLLSTAAFAAGTNEAQVVEGTKLITANVANVGKNEQVVLLIVDNEVPENDLSGVTEGQIMYIDQTQANGEGVAEFTNIAIKDTETVVDVYVGSAELGAPRLIGDDIDLRDAKVITLVPNSSFVVEGEGEAGVKAGIGVAVTVDVPEGLVINKIIYALDVRPYGSEDEYDRVYSQSYEFEDGMSCLGGSVQFAAVFNNGFLKGEDRFEVKEDSVGAIFLTNDNDPKEHFTHEIDKKN